MKKFNADSNKDFQQQPATIPDRFGGLSQYILMAIPKHHLSWGGNSPKTLLFWGTLICTFLLVTNAQAQWGQSQFIEQVSGQHTELDENISGVVECNAMHKQNIRSAHLPRNGSSMLHRELNFELRVSIYQLLIFLIPGGLLFGALLIFGIYKFKTQLVKETFNFGQEVFEDFLDNLSNRQNKFNILSNQIANPLTPVEKQQELTNRLNELVLDSMQVINNIAWSFDSNLESMDTLVVKAENVIKEIIPSLVPFALNVPTPNNMRNKLIRPQPNQLLLLVFRELLKEIINRTKSVKIQIDIFSKGNNLIINIQNYFKKPSATPIAEVLNASERIPSFPAVLSSLNLTLDGNSLFSSPQRVTATTTTSDNCHVEVHQNNNQDNADTFFCTGSWTYGLFDDGNHLVAWGTVSAENKSVSANEFTTSNFFYDSHHVAKP
jgi:hypothetical protein